MELESRLPELEILLKSAKGRMTADLIRQITEVPNIYRFQTYLAFPNVQELEKTDLSSSVSLLLQFSAGTFKAYTENASTLPALTEKQIFNLRCLSLASIAKYAPRQKIPFKLIQEELGFGESWQVFDFLIEALNYSYVTGKVDEPAGLLYVEDYATRDIISGDEKHVRAKLNTFLSACEQTLERTKVEAARFDDLKKQADNQNKELLGKIESARGQVEDVNMASAGDDIYRPKMEISNKFLKARPKRFGL